ncbi:MAG: Ser/Thr protein kinase RdoA (MazF antagonist) [Parasphingorhabdus sp.]|jgi:Ser/Thr protein kinase RdoA (MazF antagonist)
MMQVVKKALKLWALENSKVELAAARENHVYRVECKNRTLALRLHRPGYHANNELLSELQWMEAAFQGGLHVPSPLLSKQGQLLEIIDGIQVDVLSWLPGKQLGVNGEPLQLENRNQTFSILGREMARLHEISDAWEPPANFSRWAWDRDGLLGESPLWDRFWDNPTLTTIEKELFLAARVEAEQELKKLESVLDYGLIHADLIRENVILHKDLVQLIDFDDGGFGFRLFDIATTIIKIIHEPDYETLKSSFLSGYKQIRPIDDSSLQLFMLLRSLTYVGWIINRLDEPGAQASNQRNLIIAKQLATEYLNSSFS